MRLKLRWLVKSSKTRSGVYSHSSQMVKCFSHSKGLVFWSPTSTKDFLAHKESSSLPCSIYQAQQLLCHLRVQWLQGIVLCLRAVAVSQTQIGDSKIEMRLGVSGLYLYSMLVGICG